MLTLAAYPELEVKDVNLCLVLSEEACPTASGHVLHLDPRRAVDILLRYARLDGG